MRGLSGLTVEAGLCGQCRYALLVRSRTSAFLRCARADEDRRFPRYPPLPVLRCAGYEAEERAAEDEPDARQD